MDIAAGLALATQALGIAKEIRDLDKGFDSAENKAKMADLYNAIGDVKMTLADAREEIRSLEQINSELKKSFEFKETLVEHEGYKYIPYEDEPSGMPFCPVCEKNDGKYFLLTRKKGFVQFECPNCKSQHHHITSFSTKEYLKAQKNRAAGEFL